MDSWRLRDQILKATQHWYWLAACLLLGSLLGWLVNMISPAPQRATMDLYVGINPAGASENAYITAVAQEHFRNSDDFKNWQMLQLETLIFNDDFLTKTINRLQQNNSDWHDITLPELREMLSASWRNAGVWHLAARTRDGEQAQQAVTTWGEVIVEKVSEAVNAAQEVMLLDSQLTSLDTQQADLIQRQAALADLSVSLADFRAQLESQPADQPLAPADAWQLASLGAAAADWNPGWVAAFENAPTPESNPAEALAWLDQVEAFISTDLETLPAQIEAFTEERQALGEQYAQASADSLALSPNLIVERLAEAAPFIEAERSTGLAMLVGGLLGLLAWLGWIFVQASREGRA